MALIKVSLAFICLTILAFVNYSNAQNSPQDYLKAHNVARSQVGVYPLSWSTTMAMYAKKIANSQKGDCKLTYSRGVNLAIGKGSFFTGKYAVGLWVKEKWYYNHKTNKCVGRKCDHYLLVISRKSKKLGCARVRCNNGSWYVICMYSPRHIVGQKPY